MAAIYTDRLAAGRTLAELLAREGVSRDALVLALPRGGVPVAYEMARRLELELDLLLVRKIGVPEHEQLAMGAIALAGGEVVRVINEEVIATLGVPHYVVQHATEQEERELHRRASAYRGDAPPPRIAGRHVILVDDGLATGTTMRVGVEAMKQRGAAHITVAVPVAPARTLESIAMQADRVLCPETPEPFMAVGLWYVDFEQVVDEQVRELMARYRRARPAPSELHGQP